MLKELYEIGRAVAPPSRSWRDLVDAWHVNKRTTRVVLAIELAPTEDGSLSFVRVVDEEYRPDIAADYLLTRTSGNKMGTTPPTTFSAPAGKSGDRSTVSTYRARLRRWFDTKSLADEPADSKILIERIRAALQEADAPIIAGLEACEAKWAASGKAAAFLITPRIDGRLLGQISAFTERVVAWTDARAKGGSTAKKSKAGNASSPRGVCQVLDSTDETELAPDALKNIEGLNIYTYDQVSYVPGFDKSRQWRNCPLSMDAANCIRSGFRHVVEHFQEPFFGRQMWGLPVALHGNLNASAITDFQNRRGESSTTLAEHRRAGLLRGERDLLDAAREWGDQFGLMLVVFHKQQARFIVDGLIREVLPSRLNRLFRAADALTMEPEFAARRAVESSDSNAGDEETAPRFTFEILRRSFPSRGKSDPLFQKFLAMVEAVLVERRIDWPELAGRFADRLGKDFITGEPRFRWAVRVDTWLTIRFLMDVGCLNMPISPGNSWNRWLDDELARTLANAPTKVASDDDAAASGDGADVRDGGLASAVARHLARHREFFCHPDMALAFVVGVLGGYVMSLQFHAGMKNQPFRKKLGDLRLSRRKCDALIGEIDTKIAQYQRAGQARPARLLGLLGRLRPLSVGNRWAVSADSIATAVALGLAFKKEDAPLESVAESH